MTIYRFRKSFRQSLPAGGRSLQVRRLDRAPPSPLSGSPVDLVNDNNDDDNDDDQPQRATNVDEPI